MPLFSLLEKILILFYQLVDVTPLFILTSHSPDNFLLLTKCYLRNKPSIPVSWTNFDIKHDLSFHNQKYIAVFNQDITYVTNQTEVYTDSCVDIVPASSAVLHNQSNSGPHWLL